MVSYTYAVCERALLGIWTLTKIKMALSCDYGMLEMIELCIYDCDLYIEETKEGGLFTKFMQTFLATKQRACG